MSTNENIVNIVEENKGKFTVMYTDNKEKKEKQHPFLGNALAHVVNKLPWKKEVVIHRKDDCCGDHLKLHIDRSDLPVAIWDTSRVWEDRVKLLMEEENMSEEEARRDADNDSDIYQFEWDHLEEYVTEIMNEFNPDNCWFVTGCNMGWQKRSGYKSFYADTFSKLGTEIFPDCDFTMYIYNKGDYLYIRLSHHDSPTGEGYYLYRAKQCDNCQTIGKTVELKESGDHNGVYCEECLKEKADELFYDLLRRDNSDKDIEHYKEQLKLLLSELGRFDS